jgi:hypothetical protein
MQMLTEEILSPLSVKQDRRIAGLTPISTDSVRLTPDFPDLRVWIFSLLVSLVGAGVFNDHQSRAVSPRRLLGIR